MVSIYDLVYDYMDLFFADKPVDKDKTKVIHSEIKQLLKEGWSEPDLRKGFNAWKKKHPSKRTIHVTNLFATRSKTNPNLLEYGRFYYHNALRITAPPPKKHIDYDSGEITSIAEDYFLEMRASFTVEEIVRYYCRQFSIKASSLSEKRMLGTFRYLLKGHDVETILFMIDEAANISRSEDLPPPNTPLDITDYERKAKETRDEKKTEAVISGGNKIVRKKRMRRSRDGDST